MSCLGEIQHIERAIKRLATQYTESANLILYIETLLSEAQTLEDVYCSLLTDRWIDTATGKSLDIIGDIVGQPRALLDGQAIPFFGYEGHPQADTFSSVDDYTVGSRYIGLGESTSGTRILTDDEYRLFIKARIYRNHTAVTINETLVFYRDLFAAPDVSILETPPAAYNVDLGRALTADDVALLSVIGLVPKPTGVTLTTTGVA